MITAFKKSNLVGLFCLFAGVLLLWWPANFDQEFIPPEPLEQLTERVPADDIFEGPRSSKWPTVRKHFVETHPNCAACGSVEDLNVHHITPFHIDESLELATSNLIVFCRKHHFSIGHKNNWKSSNPNCVKEAAEFRKNHPWK
jgi:hypothetical protein